MNVDIQHLDRVSDLWAPGPWRARKNLLMRIDRWDAHRDGFLSESALRRKLNVLGYVSISWRYSAGTVAAVQADSEERILAVVSGMVKITIDGESAILSEGDGVYVPRGASRELEVVGTATAFCLEAVYHRESDVFYHSEPA